MGPAQERAEKNQTFLYIKIPEVPLRLSYKGEKEKNLEDLNECSLVLPTIELHNRTCTWLDLLMVIKNDARKVLLSQVPPSSLPPHLYFYCRIHHHTVPLSAKFSGAPPNRGIGATMRHMLACAPDHMT